MNFITPPPPPLISVEDNKGPDEAGASVSGFLTLNFNGRFDIKVVAADPLTLFRRMCIAKQCEDDLELFFTYELAPYPLSLFSEEGMRKGTKSSLYYICLYMLLSH